ncbi:MAG: PD40 domain-containing protein, partial [Bacteroidia bacterium]|nr:PD40 domain-containing protein [Bacteroidia bacterium]
MNIFSQRSVYLFILTIAFNSASGQESTTNQTNPPSVKWYEIKTGNFNILYPKGFDQQAQRVANTLEHIRIPEATTMGGAPKRISILLQNQSSVSNGFVTLAPRRSEFFTMPAQDYNFTGNNDWLNLLASHEYRHIVQFQQSITGFNKVWYFIFGQLSTAGWAFLAVPQWFWEGDAVVTETAFTHSGRGRMPNFDLVFRTNLLEGRKFNYDKQYLRSYKNNIPNHYVLGYEMVSHLRNKTGDAEIWNKIAKRTWNLSFMPHRFSHSIEKKAGLHVVDLYKEMAAELKQQWTAQIDSLEFTPFEKVNPRSTKAYTDYQYPQPLEDGTIVAIKSGIGDIERLVILDNGHEKSRFVQGPINDAGFLSTATTRVVWNEYRYDPRWLVKSYSMIVGYDFASGTKKIISKNTRYSSATLSPDGKKVATIESSTDYKVKLVILDYNTGTILKTINSPNNQLITMPRWSPDGKSIVALQLTPLGKAVVQYDYLSGESVTLIPSTLENIGHPVLGDKYLFYNSPFSGIDNIYALHLETGKKFQVTSSKYGSYNPAISADGKTLFYNEQGRNGLDVVKTELDPFYWKSIDKAQIPVEGLYQHLVDQEGRPNLLDSIPQKKYPVSKYNRLEGMLNVHSWGPYTNSSLSYLDLGISSKDLLGTTVLDLGYRYDATERTGYWRANASYQG